MINHYTAGSLAVIISLSVLLTSYYCTPAVKLLAHLYYYLVLFLGNIYSTRIFLSSVLTDKSDRLFFSVLYFI